MTDAAYLALEIIGWWALGTVIVCFVLVAASLRALRTERRERDNWAADHIKTPWDDAANQQEQDDPQRRILKFRKYQ